MQINTSYLQENFLSLRMQSGLLEHEALPVDLCENTLEK
jgi:hypothetical protein